MTHPSRVALHDMGHSFIELDKAMYGPCDLLVFCGCGFHSVRKPSKGQKQLKLEQGEKSNISTPGKKAVILLKKKWKV